MMNFILFIIYVCMTLVIVYFLRITVIVNNSLVEVDSSEISLILYMFLDFSSHYNTCYLSGIIQFLIHK
jgi:hypothetical protein